MRKLVLGLFVPLSGLAVSGCVIIDNPPTAAEMGAAVCEPAGPHDAAAPGDWLCEGENAGERVKPRHRVEG